MLIAYPPENEYGNIEYKMKLIDKKEDRIQEIASQMRFRTYQGGGESIYVIGVADDGQLVGVDDDEFEESFCNLSLAAKENSYTVTLLSAKSLPKTEKKVSTKKVYEVLVREKNEQRYIDVKVTVAGSVDSGKSSLLGVLTTGKNDNGRGSVRLSIFNFKHEVISGRTSSVAHHILGFDSTGQITNYTENSLDKKGWPEIVKDSSKIISFYDLCGHEKYLRTTILGLTSAYPDVCFILVGANMGMSRVTKEHIFLCVTLNIPFAIVLTKIDICKNRKKVLEETVISINKLLKIPGLRRIPYKINNMDDVVICSKNIHSESVVPIFHVSNVTGQGINFVKQFLNLLGKSTVLSDSKGVEYHINTTFSVSGVGTVVGGQLISGKITVGDKLLLGPTNGQYREIQVRSIHCKRVPLQSVSCGSYVCLGLRKIDRSTIRRGHVIISKNCPTISVNEFDAEITILKTHSTTIKLGYEPIIHTRTVRQTATLLSIKNKINARNVEKECGYNSVLRTGDKATVTFRFRYRPEYVKKGSKLLICEGNVKLIGKVI